MIKFIYVVVFFMDLWGFIKVFVDVFDVELFCNILLFCGLFIMIFFSGMFLIIFGVVFKEVFLFFKFGL